MKRSRYRRKKYFGKGGTDFIRPTLNKGRIFVGEGLRKKKYKKKKRTIYRKGALSTALLAASVIPSLFG